MRGSLFSRPLNPFAGLSHTSLGDALLLRLSRIANLRKESRLLRERLADVRSELHELRHEVSLIEQARAALPSSEPLIEQPSKPGYGERFG